MQAIREQSQMDKLIDLANYNRMVRAVNMLLNLQFSQDFFVTKGDFGIYVGLNVEEGGESSSLDMSTFAFGYTLSSPKVTTVSGYIRHGTRTPKLVSATEITIAADHTWIYLEYNLLMNTGSIKSATAVPTNTTYLYNKPLHQWRYESGVASIEKIFHVGDVDIPGMFA